MNFIFFDDATWTDLLPLSYTRPVSELRTGIMTLREKWEKRLRVNFSWKTSDYLSKKYPLHIEDDNLLINSSLLPDEIILPGIMKLKTGEGLVSGSRLLAARTDRRMLEGFNPADNPSDMGFHLHEMEAQCICNPWDLFRFNGQEIAYDYQILTENRESAEISKTNTLLGNNIFIEPGVRMEAATLNTETGPVYIGAGAEIMEGAVIRGPFALLDKSVVKLAAKIYGPTTIGPHCKVGGEINNSVFLGYSNKGHDGFLGNSVIGEWCNLGADTNNSNLKNNYAEVKLWNYREERFIRTGLQFCGLIMGDHSKCGINTMFNTGTVVGVNANIYGSGFPRNFIPSFSWGGAHGFTEFSLNKAFEVAEKVMSRRDIILDQNEKDILAAIFELSSKYRK